MTSQEHTRSVWMDTAAVPSFPPLQGEVHSDVCVIGAGIAGLTAALLMLKEGRSVTVIDAAGVGAGETGRTTAHLFVPDERYHRIEERFGQDRAKLVADSHFSATAQIEAIVQEEGIACDFARLDGYLILSNSTPVSELDSELESARRLGVEVERVAQVPGMPFHTGPALRFGQQGRFHPLKYLAGLCGAIGRRGGAIHGGTRALKLDQDDKGHVVVTPNGAVHAGIVVVATNTPFQDRVVMHTKQSGYMSYVLAARIPRGVMPDVLLWDTGDPYYYVRLWTPPGQEEHDILIVGGQDNKTGQDSQPQHRFAQIERWIRENVGVPAEITHRWSGEVMEPADGMAFLGRSPMDAEGVYLITGDSGNGMTHGTMGAMIIRDLVSGKFNPWAPIYNPSRKMFRAAGEYLSEQANTLAQYADWLKRGEVSSVGQIPPGEGGLLRKGLKLLAVYRSETGEAHAVSAMCTHLGCAVRWNGVEKSWDCPCHASRFDITGEVLHGPANAPLAKADGEVPA
ncbi:FAD-dependent oxidoreductase [Massilia endophytica]|uniref:FAD-dependent oxidoreductase n=1 Tax=Massilia endophytica TaxID=2899220 RepID=UPI001E4E8743|nr:FAD-dependent oxidoreductase [Massilia endophytica]UGQ48573.1 FAD-dependent oxidoreductase [Massilia endophytica]